MLMPVSGPGSRPPVGPLARMANQQSGDGRRRSRRKPIASHCHRPMLPICMLSTSRWSSADGGSNAGSFWRGRAHPDPPRSASDRPDRQGPCLLPGADRWSRDQSQPGRRALWRSPRGHQSGSAAGLPVAVHHGCDPRRAPARRSVGVPSDPRDRSANRLGCPEQAARVLIRFGIIALRSSRWTF